LVMSTTLEIGRNPAARSRDCIHAGEGATRTPSMTRSV